MAYKTMLRQLISKWGIMSVDMQKAYENDMAYIKEDGSKEYVDNVETPINEFTNNQETTFEVEPTTGEVHSLSDI